MNNVNVFDWNGAGHTFDEIARELAKKFWLRNGFFPVDNDDQYKVDLVIKDQFGKIVYYCEVEMSDWWKWGKYISNYSENGRYVVTCPPRKINGKQPSLISPDGKPVFWMQFCKDRVHGVMSKAEYFLENEPKAFPHGSYYDDTVYGWTEKYVEIKI